MAWASGKVTSLAMLVSTAAITAHYLLTQPIEHLFQQPPQDYGLGFAIAIFSTVIPSYMMSVGIQRIGAARASIRDSWMSCVSGFWQ